MAANEVKTLLIKVFNLKSFKKTLPAFQNVCVCVHILVFHIFTTETTLCDVTSIS